MNKAFISLLCIVCCTGAYAQISIDSSNFPNAGDSFTVQRQVAFVDSLFYLLTDTADNPFSLKITELSNPQSGTEAFLEAGNMAGGSDVPAAVYGYQTVEGNAFFRNDSNLIHFVGVAPSIQGMGMVGFQFDKPLVFIRAPMTYGDKESSTSSVSRTISFAQVNVRVTSAYEVDGYGSLELFDTGYQVLRVRRKDNFRIITTTPFGTETSYDSLLTWDFYANGVNNSLVRINLNFTPDTTGGYDTIYTLRTAREPVITGRPAMLSGPPPFHLYQPAASQLAIVQEEARHLNYRIYGLNGQLLLQGEGSGKSILIPIGKLVNALYLIQLENRKGEIANLRFYKK